MKKIVAIFASVLMILALSIPALAASGAFVSSPSAVLAPEIVEYENESDDCTAKLLVKSYADRNELPDNIKVKFEEAYDQIVHVSEDNSFSKILKDISEDQNILVDNLAVSELFDVSCSDCVNHDHHGDFTIQLKSDLFTNFVALLHYTGEEWEEVEVTNLNFENYTLTFKAGDLSPFAVVVRNGDTHSHDRLDVSTRCMVCWLLIVIAIEFAVIIVGLIVTIVMISNLKRKQKEEMKKNRSNCAKM